MVLAFEAARQIFRLDQAWDEVSALDLKIPAEAQTALYQEISVVLRRQTFWLARRAAPADGLIAPTAAARLARRGAGAVALRAELSEGGQTFVGLGRPRRWPGTSPFCAAGGDGGTAICPQARWAMPRPWRGCFTGCARRRGWIAAPPAAVGAVDLRHDDCGGAGRGAGPNGAEGRAVDRARRYRHGASDEQPAGCQRLERRARRGGEGLRRSVGIEPPARAGPRQAAIAGPAFARSLPLRLGPCREFLVAVDDSPSSRRRCARRAPRGRPAGSPLLRVIPAASSTGPKQEIELHPSRPRPLNKWAAGGGAVRGRRCC
jgi:hypothetical protein